MSRDDAIPTLWLIALGTFVAVVRWWDSTGGIDDLISPVVAGFLFAGAVTLFVGWANRSADGSITDIRFGVFGTTALILVAGSISVEGSLKAVGVCSASPRPRRTGRVDPSRSAHEWR